MQTQHPGPTRRSFLGQCLAGLAAAPAVNALGEPAGRAVPATWSALRDQFRNLTLQLTQVRAEKENRADDADPAVIERRIATYKEQSEPCIAYYEGQGEVPLHR